MSKHMLAMVIFLFADLFCVFLVFFGRGHVHHLQIVSAV